MNKSVAILLFFLPIALFAQQFKEFKGQVVHDSLSVEGVHIINKSSGATTITDKEGIFAIAVKTSDTLVFSAIQFMLHTVVVDPEVFQQDFVKVYVEARVNELEEVVVKPHDLTGDLKKDIHKAEKPINFDDVGIPGFKGKPQERIPTTAQVFVVGPLFASIDAEAVYKKLSGYYKELKKRRKMDRENEMTVRIIEFYGVRFLMENYELTLDEVYPFVLGTVMDTEIENDFARGDHNLALQKLEAR